MDQGVMGVVAFYFYFPFDVLNLRFRCLAPL